MNIQSAITEGAQILKNKFFLNSYLDSEILMAKAINKDHKIEKLKLVQEIDQKELEHIIFHKGE